MTRARALLPTGQCTFVLTDKNKELDKNYNLKHQEKIDIIKSLMPDDCVDIRENDNPRYPEAELFVFLKSGTLEVYGELESVMLYIKEYIIDDHNMEMLIVISFHEEGLYDG